MAFLRPQPARSHPSPEKRRLCDVVEEMSCSDLDDETKLERILPPLHRYAEALSEERAAELPGTTFDELVSTLGERCVSALERLDLRMPPAQQVTYLHSTLQYALADACRNLDPLGRGPRRLRRRLEAVVDAHASAHGTPPDVAERERMLGEVVGDGAKPTLRLLVGYGMTPAEAVRCMTEPAAVEDPADTVVASLVRRQIAQAVASHPDRAVREYLYKVAAGISARRPADFRGRLGPTLPALLAALLLSDANQALAGDVDDVGVVAACR